MIVAIPAPSPQKKINFTSFLYDTLSRFAELQETPDYALKSGICLYTLVKYAAGICSPNDKQWVESWLVRLPWTMRIVVALVKGSRVAESVASNLLQRARDNNLPHEDILLNMLTTLPQES